MRRLALGLAVASATAFLAAPASAENAGRVSNIHADSTGHVTLTLTAPHLPPGAGLDPSTVRVFVDGHRVPVTARASATRRAPGERVTAMLVVDTSGSMRGPGIVAARAAARDFITAAPRNVRVGLETFSDEASLVVRPTVDRQQLLSALPSLRVGRKTALYDALVAAAAATGRSGLRRLVVVSDGADTVSHAGLQQTIAALADRHIAVEVVGLDTAAADNAVLQQVATGTGGRFVLAGNGASLVAALRSSARSYATAVSLRASVPTALWGDDRHLRVAVESSAGTVVATAAASVGVVSRPTTTRSDSKRLLWEGLIAIAAALLLGATALFSGDLGSRRRVRRLVEDYGLAPQTARPTEGSAIKRTALELADRVTRSRGLHERLTTRLTRAGLSFTPSEWLLLQIGIAALTAFLFVLFGLSPVVAIVVGLVTGPVLGHLFLGFRFSRRRAAFIAALPDTLQLIAGSLSAGYSLAQSLDGVVNQGEQPISGEFGRALAESRLGVPIERTLEHVAERMDSEDFRWVVLAIQIQHKVGGNLAEVLQTVAQTMRERVQLHRHVRALSAEGRMSAYILGGLPVVFALYLLAARGEYLRPLYTTHMGLAMIGAALVLFLLGSVVMKKMIKVEV
jgi:tight adherence protein B